MSNSLRFSAMVRSSLVVGVVSVLDVDEVHVGNPRLKAAISSVSESELKALRVEKGYSSYPRRTGLGRSRSILHASNGSLSLVVASGVASGVVSLALGIGDPSCPAHQQ